MRRRCIRDLFFSVKFVVKFQNRCPPPPRRRRRRRRCCCCCSLVKPPPLLVVVVVVLVFAERGEKGGGEGKVDIVLFFLCVFCLDAGFLRFLLSVCLLFLVGFLDDASSFIHSLIHSFIKKAFVGRRVRTHHH